MAQLKKPIFFRPALLKHSPKFLTDFDFFYNSIEFGLTAITFKELFGFAHKTRFSTD